MNCSAMLGGCEVGGGDAGAEGSNDGAGLSILAVGGGDEPPPSDGPLHAASNMIGASKAAIDARCHNFVGIGQPPCID